MGCQDDLKSKRSVILLLFQKVKSQPKTAEVLRSTGVKHFLTFKAITRSLKTGLLMTSQNLAGRGQIGYQQCWMPIKVSIRRNPWWGQQKLAMQLKKWPGTTCQALECDLGLEGLESGSFHILTVSQKGPKGQKCKTPLLRFVSEKTHVKDS
jgi:hypothetical protein